MAAMRAAGALALLTSAHSNLYDVIQPHLIPPEGGCVEWASLPDQDKHWFGGKPPADAGAHCAQQGKGNPLRSQAPTGWRELGPGHGQRQRRALHQQLLHVEG